MKELIIYVGLPGSGKSTDYYNNYSDSHLRISLDVLRTRNREWTIFKAAVDMETNIVIDNTNTTKKERQRYIEYVKGKGYNVVAYVMTTTATECIERIKNRDRKVPPGIICTYSQNLEQVTEDEGFEYIQRR